MNTLTQLGAEKYIALETYKKNGDAVSTPLWVTQEAETLYAITDADSWKVKRIRNNTNVRLAKSDMRGNVQGEWLAAHAQILDDPIAIDQQSKRLAAKYGLVYRLFSVFRRVTQRKRANVVIEIT